MKYMSNVDTVPIKGIHGSSFLGKEPCKVMWDPWRGGGKGISSVPLNPQGKFYSL